MGMSISVIAVFCRVSISVIAVFCRVSISVITISGTDCKLIQLGKLADRTGGQVRMYALQWGWGLDY